MIRLIFSYNREMLHFIVREKEIWYKDRVWSGGVRCIPRDDEFLMKILLSRNKIPKQLISMFNLSEKDKQEYDSCSTETELAEKIIYDCEKQGLLLQNKEWKNIT